MVFRCAEHDIYKGNGADTWWYQFAASKELDAAEIGRCEQSIRSCLQPPQEFPVEDYELLTPINYFGIFIPAGTRYVRHDGDEWWPVINDAHCPNYAVSFAVVRNNPTYFKPIQI